MGGKYDGIQSQRCIGLQQNVLILGMRQSKMIQSIKVDGLVCLVYGLVDFSKTDYEYLLYVLQTTESDSF